MRPAITVLIYTYNSESHIAESIESARLLSESVVIIDQNSTDRTEEIASKFGATIVTVPHYIYVEPVRMKGIEAVKDGWIFILDADERMTKDLADEIKRTLSNSDKLPTTNYRLPRKNIFARKQWLKHGGWYPDEQVRLMKREAVTAWPEKIHAMPQITGTMGILKNPFLHYFHGDLENMVNKTVIYEEIESELLYNAGRKSSTPIFFRKFLGELFRRLIRDCGWKDGTVGIIESVYQAYSKTVTYLFLYEKQKT